MIRVSQLIARVQATCPGFAMVDHALTSAGTLTYPAAMISPLMVKSGPAGYSSYHIQTLTQTFGVYVLLRRTQDGLTGSGAADEFDDLVAELRAGIPHWTPDTALYAPFSYEGGQLDRWDQGVACWRDDFSTTYDLRLP